MGLAKMASKLEILSTPLLYTLVAKGAFVMV
jgi:hypothetical protein